MGGDLNGTALLVVPEAPTEADRAAILASLAAFNRQFADAGEAGPLAVLLQAAGATIGGLWGTTLFGWLRIELVFVPAELRGASFGTAILRRAEELAIGRGCIGACLDTYSFQAPGFYQKLGYRLMGTIQDCPPAGAHHYLYKRFS
jgi:GNAT superfamily N-acetyltransferase